MRKQDIMKMEGHTVSYRGIESVITAVTSIGVELVYGRDSSILSFNDFRKMIKAGYIKFKNRRG